MKENVKAVHTHTQYIYRNVLIFSNVIEKLLCSTKIIKKTCFIYNVKKYIRISKYRKANKRMDFNIKVRKNKIKLLYESLSFWQLKINITKLLQKYYKTVTLTKSIEKNNFYIEYRYTRRKNNGRRMKNG